MEGDKLLPYVVWRRQCASLTSLDSRAFYSLHLIGVIYGGTRGTVTPLFGLGYAYPFPTIYDEKMKKLPLPAVYIGDLGRFNYNKIVFGRDSIPDTAGEVYDALPDPESDGEGIPPLRSPPLSSRGTQERPVLLLNWYPHLLNQSCTLLYPLCLQCCILTVAFHLYSLFPRTITSPSVLHVQVTYSIFIISEKSSIIFQPVTFSRNTMPRAET